MQLPSANTPFPRNGEERRRTAKCSYPSAENPIKAPVERRHQKKFQTDDSIREGGDHGGGFIRTRTRDAREHEAKLGNIARVLLFLEAFIDEIPCAVV